jgi:hypothetical protein
MTTVAQRKRVHQNKKSAPQANARKKNGLYGHYWREEQREQPPENRALPFQNW